MIILTRTYARHVRLIHMHYIFGPYSPQLINCDLAEVNASLTTGLDTLYQPPEILAFLHYRLGDLIHEVNYALSSVICEFQGHNVLTLLHMLITCNPLVWSGLEPLLRPV